MKKIILLVVGILLLFTLSGFSETQVLSGGLTGSIKGYMNSTTPMEGSLTGDWNAKVEDNGNVTGHAKGKFGLFDSQNKKGFSGSFSVDYNPVTQTLTGYWLLPGSSSNNTISFSVDQFTGKFSGPIKGVIPTENGGMPFEGTITLDFQGFPTDLNGKVDAKLGVQVAWEPISVDGKIVSCAMGNNNYVTDDNGKVAGKWDVNIAPDQTLSGSAEGIFSGTADLTFSLNDTCIVPELATFMSLATTYGGSSVPTSVSFKFPYYGTWLGTLQGSMATSLFFGGSWTESYDSTTYNSYGVGFENVDISLLSNKVTGGDVFGGSLKINIDVSNATEFSIPITGEIHGGGTVFVNLQKFAKEQGVCEQFNSLLSQFSGFSLPTTIPTSISLPECAKNGDVCNCLPTEIKVKWWVQNTSLSGNMSVNK